ncbi:hypothetical protein GOODEAATRI_000734 [Goodea atripinnis]|uniref:Uncharacterized protein n=1 Tax=Goodea atripinnis TaxID=208336 RepID=A0ABV0P3X7_9TELE
MSIWKLVRFTHSGDVMCWSCKVLELLKALVSRRSSLVTVAAAPRARPVLKIIRSTHAHTAGDTKELRRKSSHSINTTSPEPGCRLVISSWNCYYKGCKRTRVYDATPQSEYDAKWRMKNSPMLTRANCSSELHLQVTMSRQDSVNSTAFSTSTPREPIILESIVLVTCVVG